MSPATTDLPTASDVDATVEDDLDVDLPRWSLEELMTELEATRRDLQDLREGFRSGRVTWRDYASQARTLRARVDALEADMVGDDLQDTVARTHPL